MPRRSRRPAAPMLSTITKPLLTTAEAAMALSYSVATLRHWANSGAGPIQPHRIGEATSHLRWRTNDVRELAGLPPLPEVARHDEKATRDEDEARATRERRLRAELTTLRQTCARIEALFKPGATEQPA